MNINDWMNEALPTMSAYKVPTLPPNAIKLDAMEMPLDFPPAIKLKWRSGIIDVALNRYPLARNESLEQLLRQTFAINKEQGVLIGNGSDELIQIILLSMLRKDAVVMAPVPTFVMYEHVAKILGMSFVGVPLKQEDFSLDLPSMLAKIAQHKPAVIFLANPNNPTGNLFDTAAIDAIIKASDGLVVIDEAYLPFVSSEQWHDYDAYNNVVVIRTLSKMGFAGLRFGYMFGAKALIEQFDKVRPPYNVNVLTQYSIEFALEHLAILDKKIQEIIKERERLFSLFAANRHLEVYPSQANFLVVKMTNSQAIHQQLIAENVWVKNLHKMHPMLANCLRISVSDHKENELFLSKFNEILKNLTSE